MAKRGERGPGGLDGSREMEGREDGDKEMRKGGGEHVGAGDMV
jgi:hypothetical protein